MGKKRIDFIAKYTQRHRGPPPKRRTDFSNFLCSSSAFLSYSKSSPDSVLELSSYPKDGLVKSRRLFPCNENELEDVGCDVSDVPPEMEPRVSKDVHDDLYMDRDADGRSQEYDISMKSAEATTELTQLKAMWKPIVAKKNDNRDSQGQALKSPDKENVSDQLLTTYDRWTSPNSSEVDDESSDRGRGKRMRRKPKIYLDESSSSIAVKSSSSRKVRRIRIMRYLGLMAPVGSPF